jgi:hypothetical protein
MVEIGYRIIGERTPNPDKPVAAKRKSRFTGEMKIEDLWMSLSEA